jgi:hypothetical protein
LTKDIVQRAVDAAELAHSPAVWRCMEPKERTAAIYKEIRRLDLEALAGTPVQDQVRKRELHGALT